jgi:hypothetical protein
MSDGRAPARSRAFPIGPSVACLLSLAGCASGPAVQTTRVGALPPQGSFAVVKSGDWTESAWDQLVDQRLQARGFSPSEAPRYLIQVSRAERPGTVRLMTPERTDSALQPPKRQRHDRATMQYLSLTVSDAKTGTEYYRALTRLRSVRGSAEPAWPRLLEASLAAPPAR